MSKITKALNKAADERLNRNKDRQDMGQDQNLYRPKEGRMKNSWLVWVFIVGVVVTILVAFNQQSEKDMVPLSEIFSEEETLPVDIQYEFVENEKGQQTIKETVTAAPAPSAASATETAKQAPAQIVAQPVAQPAASTVTTAATAPTVEQVVSQMDFKKIPFTVQVASFKEKDKAEKTAASLKAKGHVAYIVSKDLGDRGQWYRVYVGQFDSKVQAEEFLKSFQKDYANSFVISPKS